MLPLQLPGRVHSIALGAGTCSQQQQPTSRVQTQQSAWTALSTAPLLVSTGPLIVSMHKPIVVIAIGDNYAHAAGCCIEHIWQGVYSCVFHCCRSLWVPQCPARQTACPAQHRVAHACFMKKALHQRWAFHHLLLPLPLPLPLLLLLAQLHTVHAG